MKQPASIIYLIATLIFAEGAQASNRSSVDIKAGQLGDAIVQLGQQTGSSIGISDQRTTRLTVRAVRGRLSVEQAIRKLLKGQPARVIQINGQSWRIIPATPPPRFGEGQAKTCKSSAGPFHASTANGGQRTCRNRCYCE